MGPAIRHSLMLLRHAEARHRLLFVISDGKPQDVGEYGGEYAAEDTRMSLVEARAKGISTVCITFDREEPLASGRTFGESHMILLDDPRKLPRRLPEIYRKLTS